MMGNPYPRMEMERNSLVKTIRIVAPAAAVLCLAAACAADQPVEKTAVEKENAQLRHRVDKLERELSEVKQLLRQQLPPPPAGPTTRPVTHESGSSGRQWLAMHKQLEADAEARGRQLVWSTLDVQLYGYVKLDGSYDTARTDVGNYARWVESEQVRTNDDQYNMTARQTRLGLKVTGPEVGGAKTSGLLEVDFYGMGDTENKPHPRLRHAYMKIDWPDRQFSILAGQTWDVISPLYPNTLNFIISWWSGNIGWRRPQIRLTQGVKLADDVDMKLEAALTRAMGHDIGNLDPGDTGEDAGHPGVQTRVSFTFPFFGPKRTTVGFSGHYAGEEYDMDLADHHRRVCSWSANADLTQPVTDWMTVKGEMHTGKNLDNYLGSIGLGVNPATMEEVESCGGWLAASLGPWDKWRFNVGAGVEAVNGSDIRAGDRKLNNSVFGNVIYQVNSHAAIGLEISRWLTRYKNMAKGDSLRIQTSFIYKF